MDAGSPEPVGLPALNPPPVDVRPDVIVVNSDESNGTNKNTTSAHASPGQPPPAIVGPATQQQEQQRLAQQLPQQAVTASPTSTTTPAPIARPASAVTPALTDDPQPEAPAASQVAQGKVMIREPPAAAKQQKAAVRGFASPGRDYSSEANHKLRDDVLRLTHAVQQSLPEAVRRVVRDNWEKTILGSEFHQAFILNASIYNATGHIIRRAIRDFGRKMVQESKSELIAHFTKADLDDCMSALIPKLSDGFMDKVLERRLDTIDARSLINALARAGRLGYESTDLDDGHAAGAPGASQLNPTILSSAQDAATPIDPQTSTPAQVSVTGHSRAQSRTLGPGQSPIQVLIPTQTSAQAQTNGATRAWQCPMCWRTFGGSAPYEYHVKKQLCTKIAPESGFPYSCPHCAAGFITPVGQQYHLSHKVCGDDGPAGTAPGLGPNLASASASTSGSPSPAVAATAFMGSFLQSSERASPQQERASNQGDPYASLSPFQRDQLEAELLEAEVYFAPRFRAADGIADQVERAKQLDSVSNQFSSKQSNIRKKYGVRLRQRRSKAELDAQRIRLTGSTVTLRRAPVGFSANVALNSGVTPGMNSGLNPGMNSGLKHGTPDDGSEPGLKRQKVETEDGSAGLSYSNTLQFQPNANTPVKHMPVSALNTGLGGSAATAALTDPTAFNPAPAYSHGSYASKGHHVDANMPRLVPSPHALSAGLSGAGPSQPAVLQRSGSAAEPVVLDNSSDSSDSSESSDSGGDIPA